MGLTHMISNHFQGTHAAVQIIPTWGIYLMVSFGFVGLWMSVNYYNHIKREKELLKTGVTPLHRPPEYVSNNA